MHAIFKYPRTMHLRGSALQTGDEPDRVSMTEIRTAGESFVWEEKVDGANSGISFPEDRLMLQSRGHSLDGGPREKQFSILKQWARAFEGDLHDALGRDHVLYGEWMAAKHTVYYDALPHYFIAYDVLHKPSGLWLSTPGRHKLLAGLPICHVHVVHNGWLSDKEVPKRVGPSVYQTKDWKDNLRVAAEASGVDFATALAETSQDLQAEGVYLKVETTTGGPDGNGETVGRYKFVRSGFLQAILSSGSHWMDRPLIKNSLAPGVDIFARPAPVQGLAP